MASPTTASGPFAVTGTGDMWFGTQGGGVSRFDGRTFKNYTTADGLAHDSVWSIVEDRSGQLWFSFLGARHRPL